MPSQDPSLSSDKTPDGGAHETAPRQVRPTERDHADAQRLAFAPLFFQAARTARETGVLDVMADAHEGGVELSDVVAETGLSRYAVGLLLDACASLAISSLDEATGRHRLTGVGAAFLRDTRVRVSTDFVHHVCHRGAFFLEDALKSGRPEGLTTLGSWSTIYQGIPELPEPCRTSWYAFDHMYSDGILPRAVRLLRQRRVARVLDVGGNTGRFATLAAAAMEVTIVDHAVELAVARRNVNAAGVGDRVRTVAMDLLDRTGAFPTGFDAVWISQVLDCFPEDDIVSILERARTALAPEGRIFVVESFTDRQPTEAAKVALHGLSLYFAGLANGTSRMYGSSDLIRAASRAGLRVAEDRTLGPWHTMLVLEP